MQRQTRVSLTSSLFVAIAIFVGAFVIAPIALHAQTQAFDPQSFCTKPDAGATVSLSSEVSSTVTDVPIGIVADITNPNPYPLTGGALYVRVYKASAVGAKQSDPVIVDAFTATSDINMLAQSSTQRTFEWRVPVTIPSGTYRIAASFVSAQHLPAPAARYPSDGSSAIIDLKVKGSNIGEISFDTKHSTVAGVPVSSSDTSIQLAGEAIPVKAVVESTVGAPVSGSVAWKLFGWDNTPSIPALETQTANVFIHAMSSTSVSYSLPNISLPAFHLEGILSVGGSRDVISVNVVRAALALAHLRGVGIDAYPFRDNATAYVCIDSGGSVTPAGKVEVSVTKAGQPSAVVASGIYQGTLKDGAISIPLQGMPDNAKDFDVYAKLSVGEQAQHTIVAHYSCPALLGSSCPDIFNVFGRQGPSTLGGWILFAFFLILVGLALFWGVRRQVWKQ
jgi:hypothetical protein